MTNADKTLLDPCAGSGGLLLYHMKKHGIDPRNTYYNDNDIIKYENFIHANRRYDFGIPEENITCYDFLSWETDMKFDVIVGNPPYQDSSSAAKNIKLWPKFVSNSMNYADIVALITPNSILQNPKKSPIAKKAHQSIYNANFGFTYYKDLGFNYFNVGVETCYFIIKKGDGYKLEFEDTIEDIICDKVTSFHNKIPLVMENGHINRGHLSNSGEYKILFSGKRESYTDVPTNVSSLKIVMPFSSSYKSMFMTDTPTGMLNLVYYVNNIEEGQRIIDYCMSPLFRFVADRYKKTSGFTPFVKNSMVPLLNEDQANDLYNTFGLTQEEIDYVESNI